MSLINKYDFLSNDNNKTITLAHDCDMIALNEMYVSKPIDTNTISSIQCLMGGQIITDIPFKLLVYLSYVTEYDNYYKIILPKDLFFTPLKI